MNACKNGAILIFCLSESVACYYYDIPKYKFTIWTSISTYFLFPIFSSYAVLQFSRCDIGACRNSSTITVWVVLRTMSVPVIHTSWNCITSLPDSLSTHCVSSPNFLHLHCFQYFDRMCSIGNFTFHVKITYNMHTHLFAPFHYNWNYFYKNWLRWRVSLYFLQLTCKFICAPLCKDKWGRIMSFYHPMHKATGNRLIFFKLMNTQQHRPNHHTHHHQRVSYYLYT